MGKRSPDWFLGVAGRCWGCGKDAAQNERVFFGPGAELKHEKCGAWSAAEWAAARAWFRRSVREAAQPLSTASQRLLDEGLRDAREGRITSLG